MLLQAKFSSHFELQVAEFSVLGMVVSTSAAAKTYLISHITAVNGCSKTAVKFLLYPALIS